MPHATRGLLAFLLLVGAATSVCAQDRIRQSREVAAFTEVSLSIPATLHLRQGEARSVEVKATQDVLDHVEATVDDGRLEIQDASNFFERMFDGGHEGEIDVYVTASTIEAISLAGSGTITGETPIDHSSLSIDNAGSGTMDLIVSTTDLRIHVAGSGTVRLRGTADAVDAQIAGSGTVRARDLTTATAEIEVAGSGDTHLHVTDRLSASIMGSGDVEYQGAPTVDTSILGSGDVQPVEQ